MEKRNIGAHRVTDRDDVAVAVRALERGERIAVEGESSVTAVTVAQDVPLGHKIALRDIAAGEEVFKYAAPIGRASVSIPEGAHVHTHNLEGIRGRGDKLERGAPR